MGANMLGLLLSLDMGLLNGGRNLEGHHGRDEKDRGIFENCKQRCWFWKSWGARQAGGVVDVQRGAVVAALGEVIGVPVDGKGNVKGACMSQVFNMLSR